jgi:hypothetical protein
VPVPQRADAPDFGPWRRRDAKLSAKRKTLDALVEIAAAGTVHVSRGVG